MYAFVTVGTTKFEALVEAADSAPVLRALAKKGFERLVIQYGRGQYVPKERSECGVAVEAFGLKPSLQEDFAGASLVISHAGFGCLIESLNLGKAVLAVINESLMDNHQLEIASHLDRHEYATMTTPAELAEAIERTDFDRRKPMPPAVPEAYAAHLDRLLFTPSCPKSK